MPAASMEVDEASPLEHLAAQAVAAPEAAVEGYFAFSALSAAFSLRDPGIHRRVLAPALAAVCPHTRCCVILFFVFFFPHN